MNRSKNELYKLKDKLERHYRFFDKSQISPDPLEFPHRYRKEKDIEISAFVSALFAFGNIKQIIKTLEKIHALFGKGPYDFILNASDSDFRKAKAIKHRFYSGEDISTLFKLLGKVYNHEGGLKKLFLKNHNPRARNLKSSIEAFHSQLLNIASEFSEISRGLKFMFPLPSKGSACKRSNLFLRWMVRKDSLDFGIWKEIPTSQLLIPVDTHVASIARKLGLTRHKNISWRMAEEITENLKLFDSNDPVKYDFAICHIGIRGMEL